MLCNYQHKNSSKMPRKQQRLWRCRPPLQMTARFIKFTHISATIHTKLLKKYRYWEQRSVPLTCMSHLYPAPNSLGHVQKPTNSSHTWASNALHFNPRPFAPAFCYYINPNPCEPSFSAMGSKCSAQYDRGALETLRRRMGRSQGLLFYWPCKPCLGSKFG